MIQEAEGFHLLGALQRTRSRFLSWSKPHVPGVTQICTWPRCQPQTCTFGHIQCCNKCTEGNKDSPHPILRIARNQDPKPHFFCLKTSHPHSGSSIKIKEGKINPQHFRDQEQNIHCSRMLSPLPMLLSRSTWKLHFHPPSSSSSEGMSPPPTRAGQPVPPPAPGGYPQPLRGGLSHLLSLNVPPPPALDATTLSAMPDASRLRCPPLHHPPPPRQPSPEHLPPQKGPDSSGGEGANQAGSTR